MSAAETPASIQAFVDATNREDADGFLAVFAEDAVLDDRGRKFRGRDQIAEWSRSDNMGVHSHLTLVSLKPGTEESAFTATVSVKGNGYNGIGTMTIHVDGQHIASLVIS
ncbi:nuclear transport factor 2 family protein [Plantibacter sp. Mn2098]|uniref:nuclear transport factor 2 family protein n=1 Tax=Plantibacter sp. Mn2098 TaxID=3395266 RepID=UPI003BBB2F39